MKGQDSLFNVLNPAAMLKVAYYTKVTLPMFLEGDIHYIKVISYSRKRHHMPSVCVVTQLLVYWPGHLNCSPPPAPDPVSVNNKRTLLDANGNIAF